MAWYSQVEEKLQAYTLEKIHQLEHLFSKGLGPSQANTQIKLQSGIDESSRRGIVPWDALNLWRIFKDNTTHTLQSLPTSRSQRLTTSMATPTTLKGLSNFRYLLDYSYTVENELTGDRTTHYMTLGFRRLERWGAVMDRLEKSVNLVGDIPDEEGDPYSWNGGKYVPGSIKVTGFFRTVNN